MTNDILSKIYSSISTSENKSQTENDSIRNEIEAIEEFDKVEDAICFLEGKLGDIVPDKLYYLGAETSFVAKEDDERLLLQFKHKDEIIRYCYKK